MTTESELDEARRELHDLDLVLPAACGSRVDAAKQLKADLDEARAQLAALQGRAEAAEWRAERARETSRGALRNGMAKAAQLFHNLTGTRAQLAALHAAAVAHVRQWHAGDTEIGACDERLDATLADLDTKSSEPYYARGIREEAERSGRTPAEVQAEYVEWRRQVVGGGISVLGGRKHEKGTR